MLGYNQLSGAIPAELGNLSSLFQLFLSDNQLGGPLPDELTHLSGLIELAVGNNLLEGPLPLSLSDLPLVTLQFQNTGLCVPADPAFEAWLATLSLLSSSGLPCP